MATKRVDKYQYCERDILGQGSYGTVYKCVQTKTNQQFAIKVIAKAKLGDQIKKLQQELELMQKIKGENVVSLYEALETSNNFYQVIDLCETDLARILKQKQYFSEPIAVQIASDILNGLYELVRCGLIHRDLKPANILYANNRYKIGDFGFARAVDNYTKQMFSTQLGTPLYMSLQLLKGEKYTSKCDIWSFGFIFYELLYGKTPYQANSQEQLIRMIETQKVIFPNQIIQVSQDVKELIQMCLTVDENKRIGWYELFSHPIFAQRFIKFKNLQQNTQNSEIYIINHIREQIVRNDISFDQLMRNLNLPQQMTIQDVGKLFQKIDCSIDRIQIEQIFNNITNTQIVSYDQFQQWLQNYNIPFTQHTMQNILQENYDTNGFSCIQNIKRCMEKYNQTSQQYYDKFNKSKDGKLKQDEFTQLVVRMNPNASVPSIKEAFNIFDNQNKAYITKEEFDNVIFQCEEVIYQ